MKKNSLLKVIAITLLVFFVLTWIIPTGYYNGSVYTKDSISALGLGDIFIYSFHSVYLSIAIICMVVVLLIGGLYGVLNKTGAYQNLVQGIVKKFNGKEKIFLVISILLFGVLSSLTSLIYPLFILVPLFMAIICLLGFNKVTAFLSTFGAILVGRIGTTYGFNLDGYNYINNFFGLGVNSNILFRVILFILSIGVLISFVLITSNIEKKKSKSKNEEILLYEEKSSNKTSITPLIVLGSIMMIVLMVSMYNWEGAFGIQLFNDIYSKVTEFSVLGRNIFAELLGSINPFGYWTNYELCLILILNIIIIGKVYGLKFKEIFEGFIDGAKKIAGVALIGFLATLLSSVVFAQLYNLGSYTIFPTISDKIFAVFGNNAFSLSVVSGIATLFFGDLPYVFNSMYTFIPSIMTNLEDAVFIVQAVFGLISMILPTSVLLLMGLKYSDISFGEWFKKAWKLLLGLLLSLIISILLVIFI